MTIQNMKFGFTWYVNVIARYENGNLGFIIYVHLYIWFSRLLHTQHDTEMMYTA